MANKGINKRLYERRLELDYSSLEAAIRLDITKLHLKLIERGYIKVSKKLQPRFIRKYNLSEDFFDDDFLGYPTPIENEEIPRTKESGISKFLKSNILKIVCVGLLAGGLTLTIFGKKMSIDAITQTQTFYSEKVNDLASFVRKDSDSVHNTYDKTFTSQLVMQNFFSFGRGDFFNDVEKGQVKTDLTQYYLDDTNFIYNSLCVMDSNEFLAYTFNYSVSYIEAGTFFLGIPLIDCLVKFEVRECSDFTRIHMNLYSALDYELASSLGHISANYYENDDKFTYNIIEDTPILGVNHTVEEGSTDYLIYTTMLEYEFNEYIRSNEYFFSTSFSQFNVSYKDFSNQLRNGIQNESGKSFLGFNLAVNGIALAVFSFAILLISIIKSFSKTKKLIEDGSFSNENPNNFEMTKKYKPLKRDWKIFPFLPECVIRIVILLIVLASSLGFFYIFKSFKTGDIVQAIDGIAFKAEFSSAVCIAMLLLFFIKLDIIRSRKNSFVVNYVLFFVGLLYYFAILFVKDILSSSAFNSLSPILELLPGNMIWGVLAFNLLSQFLFEYPKFADGSKKKLIFFRSLCIIPIAYMTISCLYGIGKTAWDWYLPLPIANLLSAKAPIIVLFSIFYCFSMFIYRGIINRRYGKENADIYSHGNKYAFIRNIIVIVILIILGVADILVSKLVPDNVVGAGGYYLVLFLTPIVLFYRSHLGKRNDTWDLIFGLSYVTSMMLGVILIAINLSGYIASL